MTSQGWKNWAIFLGGAVVGYSGAATLVIAAAAFVGGVLFASTGLVEKVRTSVGERL